MKIAFIGGWGHRLLRPLLTDEPGRVETVAVAGDGVDNEAAWKMADAIPGALWFEDAREMLGTFQPGLVNVGPVYGKNGEWALESLRAGAVVLCEKPVATTWGQLEAIEAQLKRQPGHLFTEFAFRTHAPFRAARAAVRAGRIGEVALVTGQKSYRFGTRPPWYGDRALYGGTLPWVASHAIDAAWFCSGLRFTAALGVQGNLSQPAFAALEDHTLSLFRLENGGSCAIHADFLRPQAAPTHADDRLRLAGTSGVIEIRDGRAQLISGAEGCRDITDEAQSVPFHREVLSALEGRESAVSTAETLYLARVLLAARDAGDSGQWVPIAP